MPKAVIQPLADKTFASKITFFAAPDYLLWQTRQIFLGKDAEGK